MATHTHIMVSEKPGRECNDVGFDDDGFFWIRGYDGITLLNEDEAEQLGQALIAWARREKAP